MESLVANLKSQIREIFVANFLVLTEIGDVKEKERKSQAYENMMLYYMSLVETYLLNGKEDKALGVLDKIKTDSDDIKAIISR